jgi:hypothetical protein
MNLKQRLAQPHFLRASLPLFPGAHPVVTFERVLHHNPGRIAPTPICPCDNCGKCYAAPVLISKASL